MSAENEETPEEFEALADRIMNEACALWLNTAEARRHPSFNGMANYEVLHGAHIALMAQLKANARRLQRIEAKLDEDVARRHVEPR